MHMTVHLSLHLSLGCSPIWDENRMYFCFSLKMKPTIFSLINLFLLVSFVDNFCKQFGPRSKPDKTSGLIWIQTVLNSDGVPESLFRMGCWFWKKKKERKWVTADHVYGDLFILTWAEMVSAKSSNAS